MKRKLPEKFFEQNQRAKTRKWRFFNLNQALWGAGNREFRNSVPPFFASVDSLTNLSLTALIFAEKAAKISEISTNAFFSVVKLIP